MRKICVITRIGSEAAEEDSDDPLFGMWRDRAELGDVQAYVRKLRAPRF